MTKVFQEEVIPTKKTPDSHPGRKSNSQKSAGQAVTVKQIPQEGNCSAKSLLAEIYTKKNPTGSYSEKVYHKESCSDKLH